MFTFSVRRFSDSVRRSQCGIVEVRAAASRPFWPLNERRTPLRAGRSVWQLRCQATRVRVAFGGCRDGSELGQALHQRHCRGLHLHSLPGRSLVPCERCRPNCHRHPRAGRDRPDRPVMASPACELPPSKIQVYLSMAENRRSFAAKSADEIGLPMIAIETSRC